MGDQSFPLELVGQVVGAIVEAGVAGVDVEKMGLVLQRPVNCCEDRPSLGTGIVGTADGKTSSSPASPGPGWFSSPG